MHVFSFSLSNVIQHWLKLVAHAQWGLGKHSCGVALGRKFFEFFFSKWCILVYFIILSDVGAP